MQDKDKDIEQIQKAADAFMRIIKQVTGRESLVAWGNLDEDGLATGVTFSDNLSAQDLESICFRLIGRTYGMIDYEK